MEKYRTSDFQERAFFLREAFFLAGLLRRCGFLFADALGADCFLAGVFLRFLAADMKHI